MTLKLCSSLLIMLLALGAGCMKLGPEYARPTEPAAPPQGFQHAPTGAGAYAPADRWWEDYHDPELNRLVDEAIQRNHSIKEAAARVMEVAARHGVARAGQFPKLNFSGGYNRSQNVAAEGFLGQVMSNRRTDTYNLSLAASFEVDLWGKLSRTTEAAWEDLLAAEESRRAVVQSMIASVVSSYLQIEAVERRLSVAQRTLEAFRQSEEVVDRRYRRGLASVLDLKQARRNVATAQALIPSYYLELGRQQQNLAVLVGRYPQTTAARVHPADYFPDLPPVPPGLPSQLLTRRPDLRQAEANLKALNARVGVALATRFPTLSLTGSGGYADSGLHDIFDPSNILWSLAAGLTQPLFDAGLLESRQREAEARLSQAVQAYARSVLTSFAEVESALLTRQEEMRRHELLLEAVATARETLDTAESRYQRGLADYISVLDAQRAYFNLQDNLVLNELAILTNRVAIHRALGGGWDAPVPSPLQRGNES